jgi:hypothetical protein
MASTQSGTRSWHAFVQHGLTRFAEYLSAIVELKHVLEKLQQTSTNLSFFAKESISIKIAVQGDSNLVLRQPKGNLASKCAKRNPLMQDAKAVLHYTTLRSLWHDLQIHPSRQQKAANHL